jgi:hypothetical protein
VLSYARERISGRIALDGLQDFLAQPIEDLNPLDSDLVVVSRAFLNVELVPMLLWSLCAIPAVASYLALHSYAGTPAEAATAKPGQIGALAASAFLRVLAGYGQYVDADDKLTPAADLA